MQPSLKNTSTSVNDMETFDLAARMALRHFPVALIRIQTGLPTETVDELYQQAHNAPPPPPPPLPKALDLIATPEAAARATSFLAHYLRLAGPTAYRRIDIEALMFAHDLHLAARDDAKQTETVLRAWVLAREMRCRTLTFQLCSCGREFLAHADQKRPAACHFCSPRPAVATRSTGGEKSSEVRLANG